MAAPWSLITIGPAVDDVPGPMRSTATTTGKSLMVSGTAH